MYSKGQLVKLKARSTACPLFVLVTDDWMPLANRITKIFSGVVLLNHLVGKTQEPYRTLQVVRSPQIMDRSKIEDRTF
jgi:hypothetical protein